MSDILTRITLQINFYTHTSLLDKYCKKRPVFVKAENLLKHHDFLGHSFPFRPLRTFKFTTVGRPLPRWSELDG
jgi:hypothetical protein